MSDFMPADVGRDIVANGGLGTITAYTDPQTVTVEIKQEFPAGTFDAHQWVILGTPNTDCTPSAKDPVGATVTLTLGLAGWRPEDAGKYVRINGGLVRITTIASDLVANGVIEQTMTAAVLAPAYSWTLEGASWGGAFGWPRCGTLFEQRHWLAGSPAFPQSVWASVIGEPLNFTIGTQDDEALGLVVANGELNPIIHLVNARGLVALTTGGEFSIQGGQDRAITPTNPRIRDQSNYGAAHVSPVRVGQEIYFTQRAGRKIRALSPNQYDDGQYVSPDVTVLAEHVTRSGIAGMAYQPEPDSTLFVVRADGQLATLTTDRDQEVYAWARQFTQGAFESVSVVPIDAGYRVFVIVSRAMNGQLTRYVETFDTGLHMDAAVTGSSTLGAATWGGLTHLAGATVQVKADGVYLGEFVVSGAGQVTLPRTAKAVEIGLAYVTTIKTLTPEVAGAVGSAMGQQLSIHETIVRLLKSTGCAVNLQPIAFRSFTPGTLDAPPPVVTGNKRAGNLGWAGGQAVTLIQQTLPYDFHLLSVVSKMTVNEG